jgi:transposase
MKEYPREYKIEAVRHYIKNGRGPSYTAKELGVPVTTLRGWIEKYMSEVKETKKDKLDKKDYENLLKEKDKLLKEQAEEILILKKSIGIFTRNPQQK